MEMIKVLNYNGDLLDVELLSKLDYDKLHVQSADGRKFVVKPSGLKYMVEI